MSYTQDDPRLKSPHPSTYPWYGLPTPTSSSATVKLSLIPTVPITGPKEMMTVFSQPGEEETVPAFSFLIEKDDGTTLLWDLGMRPDAENSTEMIKQTALKAFRTGEGVGSIQYLKEKGYDVDKIGLLVLSHCHFDPDDYPSDPASLWLTYSGDLDTLPESTDIIMGAGSLDVVGKGEPEQKDSPWPSSWLEKHHIVQLPSPDTTFTGESQQVGRGPEAQAGERKWEQVGCFEYGVDWFGDGSLWFIDTPGHLEGHLMALARVTTSPPTYVLLSGDAAHDQTQYLPVPTSLEGQDDHRSPIPMYKGQPALAKDPPVLARTIGQMTRMSQEESVMVLMAHEKEAVGVLPVYPENLGAWKEEGWKAEKDKTTR